ncbi:LL-diaminopimelate aminotransferase [Alkalihalobacterium bogoriense]|uniref:LL-diaminopimelate aminotransferase n=1 Tax=Alkalihalobacterium bogoriense TaxID=246272 RepID=UPI000479BE5E|nr:LL-diaminopimelate aminotransferase [Alkalihalobacterium bogoriense]
MIQPASKLNQLATSVFSDLAIQKRQKLQEEKELIDLSIGSPDLPPPLFVREVLAVESLNPSSYGYAIQSLQQFDAAVCRFYQQRYHVDVKESEVLQLLGSQDGLAHIALAYLEKGDVMIVPNPGYPIYSAAAHLAGAELYLLPVNEENNFMPDLSTIPKEIQEKAKLMILNYPGNPASALATEAYFEQVISFGLQHEIIIMHDFAYSELIFDNKKPLSIFSLPNAKKTAIEFNSLSKSFNMAGARVGYVLGDPEILKPLAIVKSHVDYGMFLPIQKAAIAALTSDGSFLQQHRAIYENRRNTFLEKLNEIGWHVRKPDGGMFVWAKIPAGFTSSHFTKAAIDHGVVVTPGHAFGSEGEGYVRIALVQEEEILQKAVTLLQPLLRGNVE